LDDEICWQYKPYSNVMISISSVKTARSPFTTNQQMKELLIQFAAYNKWANQRLFETILALPEEKQKQELPSSFSSIYQTILHMWDAESIWWQRLKLQERLVVPSENYNGSKKDVINGLVQQNLLWQDWVNNATDPMLEHVFQYYSTKRELFKNPVSQVVLHVFNHGTYHRGQLVNMLRQLGVEKIPQTDFIVWTRKK
jgi:uncharacterized damage-inducible protein DinB